MIEPIPTHAQHRQQARVIFDAYEKLREAREHGDPTIAGQLVDDAHEVLETHLQDVGVVPRGRESVEDEADRLNDMKAAL